MSSKNTHENHRLTIGITNEMLKQPICKILKPLANNSANAVSNNF